ncbi:hypothetical protein Tco_0512612 [Tanacetum coccineum]
MEAQSFKDLLIQNMDSIEKCIVERVLYEQEICKRLNDRKLQIQECKVQEVKALDVSSRNTDNSWIVSNRGNDPSLGNESNTFRNERKMSRNETSNSENDTDADATYITPSYDIEPMDEVDSDTKLDSSDMCNNEFKDDQHADDHENKGVVLANLIANLKLDTDENKKKRN